MNNNDELEEERRLCYVGITRAKDILYLSNAKKRTLFGKQDINPPSRFIKEIDKSLIKELTNIKEDKIIKKEEMYSKNNNDFKIGDIIKHELFGNGVIINIDKDIIDVAFKSGIKKLNKNHKSITKSEGK
jgi:DNA helicase-2/ATP-dependent DNA helicase PcrA